MSGAAHWEVPAKPEQIPLLRNEAAAFAAAAGMVDRDLDDVRTVVSEAATNVVLHAYDGDAQRHQDMRLDVEIIASRLIVRVSDHGVGIGNSTSVGGAGVGLRVMAVLADTFDVCRCQDGGTEVRMAFALGADSSAYRRGGQHIGRCGDDAATGHSGVGTIGKGNSAHHRSGAGRPSERGVDGLARRAGAAASHR